MNTKTNIVLLFQIVIHCIYVLEVSSFTTSCRLLHAINPKKVKPSTINTRKSSNGFGHRNIQSQHKPTSALYYTNNRNTNNNNEMDDFYYYNNNNMSPSPLNSSSNPNNNNYYNDNTNVNDDGNYKNDYTNEELKNIVMPQMEQEIIASTNAKLDVQKVKNALTKDTTKNTIPNPDPELYPDLNKTSSSNWNIAIASGIVLATFSFFSFHVMTFSAIIFLITTYIASRDPLNETDENISGPLFRIIGRGTIQSIEKTTPKVKAVARAVISGEEEIQDLKRQLVELETENEELKLWIARRQFVDENAQFYSLDTLKNMARMKGLQVGGTKAQVMMRLIEAGCITIV